jgi:hypothetical protein
MTVAGKIPPTKALPSEYQMCGESLCQASLAHNLLSLQLLEPAHMNYNNHYMNHCHYHGLLHSHVMRATTRSHVHAAFSLQVCHPVLLGNFWLLLPQQHLWFCLREHGWARIGLLRPFHVQYERRLC